MRKLVFIALLLLSLGAWHNASAQVFKNKDFSITKLENNMWIIETPDSSSMYIVEGKEKALLVDLGSVNAKLDSVVKLITTKPLTVVITHAHSDHTGNINCFKEIWIHPADTFMLDKTYKGKINFLKDGDIFDLGSTILEVKHTPAHTPGSIVLIDKKTGNCYAGDSYGSGQTWLQLRPYATMRTYINSCILMEKLMDNGIKKIYCGHYPYPKKAYDKSYITSNRELAESIENGTVKDAKPFPIKLSFGCDNPMIATKGEANIVYNPDHVK